MIFHHERTGNVVKLWLESQGFFVMGPMRVGRCEIDILAIKLSRDKNSITKRVQVEVTVSGRPGGPDDGRGPGGYLMSKFRDNTEYKARELRSNDYERWVVIGKMLFKLNHYGKRTWYIE